ncbi:hypothetical protein B0H10DRAFT_1948906 [Mycena sp. CBHHK59/15]|nr:hypothetical protein B0H10DRAFT_1948906 [Mycena sp. CBHHK59/15]
MKVADEICLTRCYLASNSLKFRTAAIAGRKQEEEKKWNKLRDEKKVGRKWAKKQKSAKQHGFFANHHVLLRRFSAISAASQAMPLQTLIMLAVLFGKAEKPCTQRDSKKVMEEELLMQALAEKEEDNIPFDGAIEIDPDDKYLFRL